MKRNNQRKLTVLQVVLYAIASLLGFCVVVFLLTYSSWLIVVITNGVF